MDPAVRVSSGRIGHSLLHRRDSCLLAPSQVPTDRSSLRPSESVTDPEQDEVQKSSAAGLLEELAGISSHYALRRTFHKSSCASQLDDRFQKLASFGTPAKFS